MPASSRALSTKRAEGFPSLECLVLNAIINTSTLSKLRLERDLNLFRYLGEGHSDSCSFFEHGARTPPVALRNDRGYVKKTLD